MRIWMYVCLNHPVSNLRRTSAFLCPITLPRHHIHTYIHAYIQIINHIWLNHERDKKQTVLIYKWIYYNYLGFLFDPRISLILFVLCGCRRFARKYRITSWTISFRMGTSNIFRSIGVSDSTPPSRKGITRMAYTK